MSNYFPIKTGRIKRRPGPGNPGMHPLGKLQTMIWCEAVRLALNIESIYTLERKVEPHKVKRDDSGSMHNNKFAKYETGKHVPIDKPGGPIENAEKVAEGTARWFRSPLWAAMKGEFEESDDIRDLIRQRPTLQSILFSCDEHIEYDIAAHGDLPALVGTAPVITFEVNRICDCIQLEGLDLLEAIVLLLEYGHVLRKPAITSRALDLYQLASPKICEIPELQYSFELFFGAVEDRYANFLGVPIEEIFPPWHARMPELLERVYDIDAMKEESLRQS
jgi:hypothetical protein